MWLVLLNVFNLFVGILCLIWLAGGLIRQYRQWNLKTHEFWYSRLLYALIQCSFSVLNIQKDRDFDITLGLMTVAGIITLHGLNIKGSWGYIHIEPLVRPDQKEKT